MKKNVKRCAAITLATILSLSASGFVYAKDNDDKNVVTSSDSVADKSDNKVEENLDEENAKVFNFTKDTIKGTTSVMTNNRGEAPVFSEEKGFGFVSQTCALPPRDVELSDIFSKDDGFYINEKDESRFVMVNAKGEEIEQSKCTTYNFGGMVFRVAVPSGAYKIEVETTGGADLTSMAVSGMQTTRIETNAYWDAAKLIPVKNVASWNDNTWSFNFVTGLPYIDVEIEPKKANVDVGVKSIKITPIEVTERKENEKPTVFTLGDSTVKSYIFEEAPMCGWGQVIDRLFDLDKVDVVNYSMGGRSMKSMYQEGRFNDALLNGKKGDYILIQSGHNDERKGTAVGTADGENARFGGGSTEEMYKTFITDYYIPAVKARGMIPVLVTPMSRANGNPTADYVYKNSFTNRKFPQIMKETAKEIGVSLVDLNTRSVEYFNEIGTSGTTAIVLSLEAGETPGKTNSGSFANGHPDNKVDGTHFKEALAKQYARIIVDELYKDYKNGDNNVKNIVGYLKSDVKEALESGDWSKVFPEVCNDTISGLGSYYRNQIEKMVQLGVMQKDKNGNFNPLEDMYVEEYIDALSKLWDIDKSQIRGYKNVRLTREVMASILYDAYNIKFKEKPAYMTNYNGTALSPDDPNYDDNLVGESSMYYPLAGYGTLTDVEKVSPEYSEKVKEAYNLGLIRSESDITRGTMKNGTKLAPKQVVSRAKAAKSLYFAWVLSRPINSETDWLDK